MIVNLVKKMNRKQIFEIETEYVLNDLKEGVSDTTELIIRFKKRKLIPENLRYMWELKCYEQAKKFLTF